jgi:hypothetical protein
MLRRNYLCLILVISTNVGLAEPSVYVFPTAGRHILTLSLGKSLMHPCSRPAIDNVTGFWEPSGAQIQEMETRLTKFLMRSFPAGPKVAPPPGSYDSQYIGITRNGRHLIYGNFYPPGQSEDHQTTTPVDVCDSGSNLWRIVFNPRTKTFSDLAMGVF